MYIYSAHPSYVPLFSSALLALDVAVHADMCSGLPQANIEGVHLNVISDIGLDGTLGQHGAGGNKLGNGLAAVAEGSDQIGKGGDGVVGALSTLVVLDEDSVLLVSSDAVGGVLDHLLWR